MWMAMMVKAQVVSQEGLGLNVGIRLGVFYLEDVMIESLDSE